MYTCICVYTNIHINAYTFTPGAISPQATPVALYVQNTHLCSELKSHQGKMTKIQYTLFLRM